MIFSMNFRFSTLNVLGLVLGDMQLVVLTALAPQTYLGSLVVLT